MISNSIDIIPCECPAHGQCIHTADQYLANGKE